MALSLKRPFYSGASARLRQSQGPCTHTLGHEHHLSVGSMRDRRCLTLAGSAPRGSREAPRHGGDSSLACASVCEHARALSRQPAARAARALARARARARTPKADLNSGDATTILASCGSSGYSAITCPTCGWAHGMPRRGCQAGARGAGMPRSLLFLGHLSPKRRCGGSTFWAFCVTGLVREGEPVLPRQRTPPQANCRQQASKAPPHQHH